MIRKSQSALRHVFIIGSKGIPANYGGFETFVDKLTANSFADDIKYHVACITSQLTEEKKEFEYQNAHCFTLSWKNIGPGRAVIYDIEALNYAVAYCEDHIISHPLFYILACRIGPFINIFKKRIQKLDGIVLVNPDGHEWLRGKWNRIIKVYWKYSEQLMVKHADLLICDSRNIEKYINKKYSKYNPKTKFIAYGAELYKVNMENDNLEEWYRKNQIKSGDYYLIVGRFVPENNYETMIKEFMRLRTKKDLVIVTNIEQNHFYDLLKKSTCFEKDVRIKFVGTVYDQELLQKVRQSAYGYLHGHEVGGTNPSLLEALANTQLNLLYDVGFNREVGGRGAVYWTKKSGNLASLIEEIDLLDQAQISHISEMAKERIRTEYSWGYIVKEYEDLFHSMPN